MNLIGENCNRQGDSFDWEYELKYGVREWINIYLKLKSMSVRDLKLYLPCK